MLITQYFFKLYTTKQSIIITLDLDGEILFKELKSLEKFKQFN
jgi:hypothetical protein